MDSEVQRVYDRLQLYFLVQKHPKWTDKAYAEQIGRCPRWVRKWRGRLADKTTLVMQDVLSRSRAPKTRPRQTPEPVKEVISQLREELSETYYRRAGARLILLHLNEQEALFEAGHFVPSSASAVHRVLKEMGYIPERRPRYREPLSLPDPDVEWEMDFGEVRLDAETKLEFFLVVDRGTSRVVYLEGSLGYNARTALQAVARLLKQCGCPRRLRFDRDPRFVGSWTGDSFPSALVRFLRVVGVEPVICPPRRPDKKPFVERAISTLKHEWLDRHSLDSYADGLEALAGFQAYHNQQRVHFGEACGGRIPDKKFSNRSPLPPLPEQVDPNVWMQAYNRRVFRRRITSNGSLQIDKYSYYVDKKRAKTNVLVYLDAARKQFQVMQGNRRLATLDIKGLAREGELDFEAYLGHMEAEAQSIEMHRLMTWFQYGDTA